MTQHQFGARYPRSEWRLLSFVCQNCLVAEKGRGIR